MIARSLHSGIVLLWIVGCSSSQSIITPTQTPTPSPPPEISTPVGSSTPNFETLEISPDPPTQTISPTEITVVRFAVIGDYGKAGEHLAQVAELIDDWQPDFIITTGDNNYPDGEAETIDENIGQYFHNYIYPYLGSYGDGAQKNKFFPSLGNHDWRDPGAAAYREYFTLPNNERYYEFSWEFIHFFAIDSDSREPDGIGKSSDQAAWLKKSLAGSTAPWKIVYMHHPPFSSGPHGDNKALKWPYKDWGATIVFGGHDHIYERLEVDGFPYIVTGLGGNTRYEFSLFHPNSLVRYRSNYGALFVEATSTSLNIKFVNIQGDIIDQFQINKES